MDEKETTGEEEVVVASLESLELGVGLLVKGDRELEGKGVTSLPRKELEDRNVNPQVEMVRVGHKSWSPTRVWGSLVWQRFLKRPVNWKGSWVG